MSSALESELTDLVNSLESACGEPRILQQTALENCRTLPVIEYMKISAARLAGAGDVCLGTDWRRRCSYIDDKARGVHEGYLVTPITKLELVLGLQLAGAIKAGDDGRNSCLLGPYCRCESRIFKSGHDAGAAVLMIVLTSLAFNTIVRC